MLILRHKIYYSFIYIYGTKSPYIYVINHKYFKILIHIIIKHHFLYSIQPRTIKSKIHILLLNPQLKYNENYNPPPVTKNKKNKTSTVISAQQQTIVIAHHAQQPNVRGADALLGPSGACQPPRDRFANSVQQSKYLSTI